MGCHTWFFVKYEDDLKKLKKIAKKEIAKEIYSDDYRKMYNYAMRNNLKEVIANLVADNLASSESVLPISVHSIEHGGAVFMEIEYHSLLEYNAKHGTNHKNRWAPELKDVQLYAPHDIFRIGGYPDDWLFSLAETKAFCELNNINIEPKDMDRLEDFFKRFPDGKGSIHFG